MGEKLQKASVILQIAVLSVASGLLVMSFNAFNKSNEILDTAQKSLDAATSPPYLIMELQPEKSGNRFNDNDMTYLITGADNERYGNIRINIWNAGTQVAENVTVSLTFNPRGADIVDTMTMQKCRDIVCNTSPDGEANRVKIRAIEAGGFYTVVAEFRVFPLAIANMTEPLNMTIEVDNPAEGHEQKITQTYEIDIGKRQA